MKKKVLALLGVSTFLFWPKYTKLDPRLLFPETGEVRDCDETAV